MPEKNNFLVGTFVAAILTLDKAYLYSDGVITQNHPDYPINRISDTFSKAHPINSNCGILTYGRYLPKLVDMARSEIRIGDDLEQIKNKFRDLFTTLWKKAPKEGVKTGAIIVVLNKKSAPCCFVVESTATPEFVPGPLNQPNPLAPIIIAAICHDEEQLRSSEKLKVELQKFISMGFQPNREIFRKAFDNVKAELSQICDKIGGQTFELILDNKK